MDCPNCHQYVTDGTPHCPHCGTPLEAQAGYQGTSSYPIAGGYDSTQLQPVQAQQATASYPQADPYQQSAQPYPLQQPVQGQQPYGASPGYQQPPYGAGPQPYGAAPQPYPTAVPPQSPVNGKATGSLVCGIFALCTAFFGFWVVVIGPVVGIIFSIVALVLGISALKVFPDGKAKAGKIMGIIGMVLNILILVVTIAGCAALFSAAENVNWNYNTTRNTNTSNTTPGGSMFGMSDSAEGTWYVTAMTVDGEEYDDEVLGLMYSMGIDVALTLRSNGTAEMTFYDETETGSWTEENGEITVIFEDQRVTGHMSGQNLILVSDDGSTNMTFSREKPQFDSSTLGNLGDYWDEDELLNSDS